MLKGGKSSGTDVLNAELYKTGEGIVRWMQELLNEIERKGECTEGVGRGNNIPYT